MPQLCGTTALVLFLDLVKAFDRVIRELVFGRGSQPPTDIAAFLRAHGVFERAAPWIIDYLNEHGNLLAQWKVDEGVAVLAESLHAGAWFGVADITTVVRTTTRGRRLQTRCPHVQLRLLDRFGHAHSRLAK